MRRFAVCDNTASNKMKTIKKLIAKIFGLDLDIIQKDLEISRLQSDNASITKRFADYRDKAEKYIVQLKKDRKDYADRLEQALSATSVAGNRKHGKNKK
jgi:hypothetical protein